MKKVWNAPDVQELTIQSTAHGHYKGYGDRYGNGRGDGKGDGGKGGNFGNGGKGNLCWCEGGTSPCPHHHSEDATS